jgi:hypothetical protein
MYYAELLHEATIGLDKIYRSRRSLSNGQTDFVKLNIRL